jgi:hypothetical protein
MVRGLETLVVLEALLIMAHGRLSGGHRGFTVTVIVLLGTT